MAVGEGERRAAEVIDRAQAQQEESRTWFAKVIFEAELIDEDEEELEEPAVDEFSSIGGGAIR